MTGLAEAAAEAYLSGWALTEAPVTDRTHAGCFAAAGVALDHRHDPRILEAALELGQAEGTWALVNARRERLLARHLRTVLAAWKACTADLDPRDVVRAFRRDAYITAETATKDPTKRWWQDTGIATALAWLRNTYHRDGYDDLVSALADAIRAGMAEGEADALALAAARQGRTGFALDRAFKVAYARLAAERTLSQQAADAAVRIIDGAAGDIGRRLAALAGDDADEDAMTSGVQDVTDTARSLRATLGDVLWTVMGAAALSLFTRASQPPPGAPPDSGVTVLVDWNTEPGACPLCEENRDGGPYAPQDVPAYLAHYGCRCWLSAASGLPAWMLAAWIAGDD